MDLKKRTGIAAIALREDGPTAYITFKLKNCHPAIYGV
jgi:hypothetical protein